MSAWARRAVPVSTGTGSEGSHSLWYQAHRPLERL